MTKQHLEALASALNVMRPPTDMTDHYSQWMLCVRAVAGVCARYNKQFDRQRFFTACGMDR
jgi:hypothetical protein